MKEKEINHKLFATPFLEFQNHLQLEENHRILFSGRYGIGKSTFINWFFKEKGIADKYKVLHIYPVNYSVASNEDIFKYIKMDILLFLLEHTEIEIEHIKLSSLELLPTFLQKNAFEIFTTAVSVFAAAKGDQKFTPSIMTKVDSLKGKFNTYKKETNKEVSDLKKAHEFMAELTNKEGSIYEFNFISELIVELLGQWKLQNNEKEIILIIDDLDRIDPHHIFRLFNVFAAHFDHPTATEEHNKFGFDKVMLVADGKNIREIFHHRYGANVDFSGYIDKFYSHSIFAFNNTNDLKEIVYDQLGKIQYGFDNVYVQGKQARHIDLFDLISRGFIDDTTIFLTAFLLTNRINFRTLEKTAIVITNKRISRESGWQNWQSSFVVKVEVLEKIIGSIPKLLECLLLASKELNKSLKVKNYEYMIGEVLPVFNLTTHRTRSGQTLSVQIGERWINYKVASDGRSYYATDITFPQMQLNPGTPIDLEENGPSIFEVYYQGIKELQRIGYFTI